MLRHHRPTAQTTVVTRTGALPWSGLLILIVLALAVVAAGCGVATGHGSAQPQGADAVHEAWVTAVRGGDADVALALTDPELAQREQFAREAVSRMQDYRTNAASPTGALEDVTVEPVSDGVGRSVWQFAEKRWCYRAELVSRAASWFVSRWGQTSVDCQ